MKIRMEKQHAKTWETVRGELKIDDKDEAIVQI